MEFEVKHKITGNWTDKIMAMGFIAKKDSHQIDHYYINNERRDDGRHYFRIREDLIGKTASLDYHVVITDLATEETEISINNIEGAKIILGYIGLKPICTVDKQRKSFSNGTVVITLDTVKELGHFLEIEVIGEDEARAQEEINRFEQALGLNEKTRIQKCGYPDLLIEKIGRA